MIVTQNLSHQLVYRIGLWGSSGYLFWTGATLYASAEIPWRSWLVLLLFAIYTFAFVAAALGTAHPSPRRWLPLIPVALTAAILVQYGLQIAAFPRNPIMTDSFILADYAAELTTLGINPYTWDYASATSDYRALPYWNTPLLDGGEVSNLPYPALSFLIFVPFKLLGVAETRLIFVLALIAMLLLFYHLSPDPWQAITPLLLVVYPGYVAWSLGFVLDAFWALLLLAMVAAWRWRNGRAIFYGLACAFKQQPWLLIPFLLLRLWLDKEDTDPAPAWQRVIRFALVSGSAFLLWNAPFVWLNFPSWLRGVFSPLGDPLIYYGQGLSAVTQYGWLPLVKNFYTALTFVVMATLLLLYAFNFSRLKETVWLFPGIFMWFAYRSLQSYFVFWPLLVVMALMVLWEKLPSPTPPWHRATPALLNGALLSVTVCMAYFTAPSPISVSLVSGDALNLEFVNRMEISVTNHSRKPLTPRIAVMSALPQPYAWQISGGPSVLKPGETAVYQATTDLPYRWVHLTQGAQIVVMDAGGNYSLRGSFFIPPDTSLRENTTIFNASYAMTDNVPSGWQLSQSGEVETAFFATQSGPMPAITLTLNPAISASGWTSATLGQTIRFPFADVTAWLFPPPVEEASFAYGLEFDDGHHRLWLLYGDEAGEGFLATNHAYISRPAPPQIWQPYTFNLADIYEQLGWPLPPWQRFARGNLEYLTPTVTVRLLLATRDPSAAPLAAQFGPMTVTEANNDSRQRQIAANVAQAADYYQALGDLAQDRRNYETAQRHYHRAATLADPARHGEEIE